MGRKITRTLTIRRRVREAVADQQPCKAGEVVDSFDGVLTEQQVWAALSQLVGKGELNRTGAGYYEIAGDATADPPPPPDAPDAPERSAPMTFEFFDEGAELDERLIPAPVDVTIQNAEEKLATCELLEKLLAPHLAERVRLIRADLQRLTNL